MKTIKTNNPNNLPIIAYSKLIDLQGNLKILSENNLNKLKSSIIKYGFFVPKFVWKSNGKHYILDGHQTVKACESLETEGYEIPGIPYVEIQAKDRKDAGEKLLQINSRYGAINPNATFFEDFNIDLSFLDEIEIPELNIDLEVDTSDVPEAQIDKADELQEKWKVERGQVWELKEHKIMCGDATCAEDIKKLINNSEIKLCFTSPPYNMAGDRYKNYDDNLKSQEYIDFNINTIKNIRPYLKGYLFWNISYNKNSRWEWIEIFYRITKETGINFLEKIVWDKGHGTPITSKKQLTRQYEDIYLGGIETEIENELTEAYLGTSLKKYAFNKRTGKGISNYWRITTNDTQTKEHSACFPVALPVKAILLMSIYNDNVLDPFIGLGSTLIACEKTNRICFGMEIYPPYVSICLQRMSDMGLEPKLINNK